MKRLLSLLLVLTLVLAAFPVIAYADAAEDIYVYGPKYHSSGALASISTTFRWTSGAVDGRLILSSKRLEGGDGTKYNNNEYGSFTNAGIYASSFSNFDAAKNYNSNYFQFITYSGEQHIATGANMTLNIPDGTIPMNTNGTYYVYLWVQNGSYFYPDNLICVIQVENGKLTFTPATKPATPNAGFTSNNYRNYYEDNNFQEVPEKAPEIFHECKPSKWLWDDTNHWQMKCGTAGCQNRTVKINQQAHSFTDASDTTCDCGYTRTAPAEKPATGDVTHIPMWTALFLGGVALLWIQLEQRKRQYF